MNPTEVEQLWGHRNCEVCRGNQNQLLFRQRFVPMSTGNLLTGYDVVACGRCGFCYANFIPDQDVFDRYYRDMSKYERPTTQGKANDYDLARFQETALRIRPYLPASTSRILEIGCATGTLLALLKDAGYRQVSGLDPSPVCCQVARESIGIPMHCGTLSDNLVAAESFDFLILIGVLEHLREVSGALQKLKAMLVPGGRLFITVPDASRYSAGDDAPFQEFSLEHINFFGPRSLANLMAAHGFTTLRSEQSAVQPNFRTVTPVIHACFEKATTSSPGVALPFDGETVRGLEDYIARSDRENQAIQPRLEELASSQRPIIVWGAGCHTLRLLATSALARANIRAIVDSNPRYQDKTVNNIPILDPGVLSGFTEAILISSRVFQNEIQKQIVEGLKLKNEVITLYQLNNPG
jgi:SAM-dependent methyltransferase